MRPHPVDRGRNAGRSTDESTHDAQGSAGLTPGLIVVAGALLAFVVCVATFALGQPGAGVAAAIVAMLAFGAGLSWLSMDRRRDRDAERAWLPAHPAR